MPASEHVDVDTEAALLAAVLSERDAFDAVADVFKPKLFAAARHQLIASAICSVAGRRQQIEPVTVNGVLADRKLLGSEVPEDTTFKLAAAARVRGSARTYVNRLANLTAARELRGTLQKALADPEPDAGKRIANASRALLEIELGHAVTYERLGDVTRRYHDDLSARHHGRDSKGSTVFSSGFRALDNVCGGFRTGLLAVFGARPGSGKSSLAVALAQNIAGAGTPVGVFWLEDSKADFAKRITSRTTRIPTSLLQAPQRMNQEHFDRISVAQNETIERLPLYIDDTHGLTAMEIAQRMRRMAREHGVRVFIADHLGEIQIEREQRWGDRHDLAIGTALRIYRDTAQELNAAPILFAQMNRQIDKRGDGIPRMSDFEGSGHIEQAARFGGFVSRPDDLTLQIHVLKNTNGPPNVTVQLQWKAEMMSVEED